MTAQRGFAIVCLLLALATCQSLPNDYYDYDNYAKAGCSLPYANFPDKEPVFLNTDYSLIEPANSAIELATNQEVLIACPGSKNILLVSETNLETAKCVKNDLVKIGKTQYGLDQLNCTKAVSGEVVTTTESCGNKRGVIKTVGHTVADGTYDVLFKICYEDSRGESLYADHILYGSAIKYTKKDSTRPGFKNPGLGPGVNADVAYKQATQKTTFTSILGSAELADKYINPKSFLARGHLAPDGDFVYISSQYSSYFYINTVPQWQAVNNGNWKSLEFSVRNAAANMGKNLRVVTGGHETLQLEDVNGNLQDMYLVSNSKLPVPKWSWKILQDPDTNKAIAFVTLNNPFVDSVSQNEYLCPDICQKNGWGVAAWSNVAKGVTYCCDVTALRKVIKTIPDIKPSGILQANNSVWYRMLM